MIDDLKLEWSNLCYEISNDKHLVLKLWSEIESNYSKKSRYYHSLTHIKDMLNWSAKVMNVINDNISFLFALWYHDIVYKAFKNNNEEKSAELAKNRLQALGLAPNKIQRIGLLINSTKKHEVLINDNTFDNHYLLDIDLSILGANWDTYKKYCTDIRKEYSIYPTFIYNKERKRVLQNFLKRDTLFFTDYFKAKLEEKARNNIKRELELL